MIHSGTAYSGHYYACALMMPPPPSLLPRMHCSLHFRRHARPSQEHSAGGGGAAGRATRACPPRKFQGPSKVAWAWVPPARSARTLGALVRVGTDGDMLCLVRVPPCAAM